MNYLTLKDMPKLSPFRQAEIDRLKRKAIRLYKKGLTIRQIAPQVGKGTTWVNKVVRHLSTP